MRQIIASWYVTKEINSAIDSLRASIKRLIIALERLAIESV